MATDLAEFVGAAVGLNLLFHVPLRVAGPMTAVVAFAILTLEQRGYRRFEMAIVACSASSSSASPTTWRRWGPGRGRRGRAGAELRRQQQRAARGGHRRRDRHAACRLPALGSDEVPGVLRRRRRASGTAALPAARRTDRAGRGRPDHLSMLFVAASLASRTSSAQWRRSPLRMRRWPPGRRWGRTDVRGRPARLGLSSSSVGTYAGQVVMQGFIGRRIPLFVRRGLTMLPALVVLELGLPPPAAWSSRRSCSRSASRSRWCRWWC